VEIWGHTVRFGKTVLHQTNAALHFAQNSAVSPKGEKKNKTRPDAFCSPRVLEEIITELDLEFSWLSILVSWEFKKENRSKLVYNVSIYTLVA
jgi:hypothetical protein